MEFRGAASSGVAETLDLPTITARTVFVFLKAINTQTASNRYHALLGESSNTSSFFIDVPAGSPGSWGIRPKEIGRAHVCTPATNAHLYSLLLREKNNQTT